MSATVTPGRVIRPQGGGPQPVLSEADLERMVWRASQGWTLAEIATEVHVHPSTAGRYLRGRGIHVPRRYYRTRQIDSGELLRTLQLADEGYSARDIAQLLDRHPTSIRQRLRRHRGNAWRYRKHRLSNDRFPPRA